MMCSQKQRHRMVKWTVATVLLAATLANAASHRTDLTQPPKPVFPPAFEGVQYVIFARNNQTVCNRMSTATGPAAGLLDLLQSPLPDLSNWTYAGTATVSKQPAHKWVFSKKVLEKVAFYSFYTTLDAAPLKMVSMGRELIIGSHFDEYVVDFTLYKPGPPSQEAFHPPHVCSAPSLDAEQGTGAALPLLALLPWVSGAALDATGTQWLQAAGGSAGGGAAALMRSRALLEAWQQQPRPYSLRLNRFADWPEEKFAALMRSRRRSSSRLTSALDDFSPRLTHAELPAEVDWRGSGMDMVVKDQATCGSCWAFAATGAMEGAWFLATGQTVSLSEQQLVDCSWDYQGDNGGCGGADSDNAIHYVARSGGIALEEDYQYMGQNAFCRAANTSRAAHFQGFRRVPSRNKTALMEAVALHGPVAVSIDAANETFKFYSEGVYVSPECRWHEDELDHAVLLVGYGTSSSGEPYWLIRNSWSKFWGEDGYVRISRRYDCGVTTSPVMAVVDKESAARSKAAAGSRRRTGMQAPVSKAAASSRR